MIRCIVVDDEKPARDELKFLLDEYDDIEVIKTFDSAKSALKDVKNLEIDVAFLDINMPGVNGIDLVDILSSTMDDLLVVFVTAHNEYAVKAFELNAFDYLLKPISESRLDTTVGRIRDKIDKVKSSLSNLEGTHDKKPCKDEKFEQIMFQKDGKFIPVKSNDIVYLCAEGGSVKVVTSKGVFFTSQSLTNLERVICDDMFFKCHRSYIININWIENVEPWFNRTYQIKLINQSELIPVSRNSVAEFKAKLHIL